MQPAYVRLPRRRVEEDPHQRRHPQVPLAERVYGRRRDAAVRVAVHQAVPEQSARVGGAGPPSPARAAPSPAAQPVVLDGADTWRPAGSREGEDRELQEATRRSQVEGDSSQKTPTPTTWTCLISAWGTTSRCALLIWPGMTPSGWSASSLTIVASPTWTTTSPTYPVWTATGGSTMTTAGSAVSRRLMCSEMDTGGTATSSSTCTRTRAVR